MTLNEAIARLAAGEVVEGLYGETWYKYRVHDGRLEYLCWGKWSAGVDSLCHNTQFRVPEIKFTTDAWVSSHPEGVFEYGFGAPATSEAKGHFEGWMRGIAGKFRNAGIKDVRVTVEARQ